MGHKIKKNGATMDEKIIESDMFAERVAILVHDAGFPESKAFRNSFDALENNKPVAGCRINVPEDTHPCVLACQEYVMRNDIADKCEIKIEKKYVVIVKK